MHDDVRLLSDATVEKDKVRKVLLSIALLIRTTKFQYHQQTYDHLEPGLRLLIMLSSALNRDIEHAVAAEVVPKMRITDLRHESV